MVYVNGYTQVTSTGSPVKVLGVPENTVAYLRALVVTNEAASPAKVTIMSGDGSDTDYDYTIMTLIVPASSTIVLDRTDLEGFHATKDIYVVTDQQPVDVAITVEAL